MSEWEWEREREKEGERGCARWEGGGGIYFGADSWIAATLGQARAEGRRAGRALAGGHWQLAGAFRKLNRLFFERLHEEGGKSKSRLGKNENVVRKNCFFRKLWIFVKKRKFFLATSVGCETLQQRWTPRPSWTWPTRWPSWRCIPTSTWPTPSSAAWPSRRTWDQVGEGTGDVITDGWAG